MEINEIQKKMFREEVKTYDYKKLKSIHEKLVSKYNNGDMFNGGSALMEAISDEIKERVNKKTLNEEAQSEPEYDQSITILDDDDLPPVDDSKVDVTKEEAAQFATDYINAMSELSPQMALANLQKQIQGMSEDKKLGLSYSLEYIAKNVMNLAKKLQSENQRYSDY